jgi:hypothetical protein
MNHLMGTVKLPPTKVKKQCLQWQNRSRAAVLPMAETPPKKGAAKASSADEGDS